MEYVLKFTEQEMHVINIALGDQPFKLVAPVVQSINMQIIAARQETQEAPASDKKD